jgi:hypothetical protein
MLRSSEAFSDAITMLRSSEAFSDAITMLRSSEAFSDAITMLRSSEAFSDAIHPCILEIFICNVNRSHGPEDGRLNPCMHDVLFG